MWVFTVFALLLFSPFSSGNDDKDLVQDQYRNCSLTSQIGVEALGLWTDRFEPAPTKPHGRSIRTQDPVFLLQQPDSRIIPLNVQG
ncbi:hypothetical protein DFH27DRAFT_556263 [Peziza echinospora]|nr:hypothetical protein DFH27DRAFT_556263 [Peziza echinospora]